MKPLLVLLIKALIFWLLLFGVVGGGLYFYWWRSAPEESTTPLDQVMLALDARDMARAEELAKKGLQATAGGTGAAQQEALAYKRLLIEIYAKSGRSRDAEMAARDVLASIEKTPGTSPSDVAIVRGQLADLIYQQGNKEEAYSMLEQVVGEIEAGKITGQEATAYGRYLLGRSLAEKQRYPEAIKHLELALKEVDVLFPEHPEEILDAEHVLARSFLAQKSPDRARAVLTRAVHQMENTEGISDPMKVKIYTAYSDVMAALNNPPEAALWSAKAANVTTR